MSKHKPLIPNWQEDLQHAARQAWLPVLLAGPTGVGKSYYAQQMHRASGLRGPCLTVNCAALPPDLLEAELLGTEAGAYTGAVKRPGKLEQAAGGTLFLDEIRELPLVPQAKLLLAVEARAVTRLGGTRSVPVTARLVYATQRDLPAEVAAGRFRADLYYRIAGYVIALPALAQRRGEIPALAEAALADFCRQAGALLNFAPRALGLLQGAAWPGNIRELRSVVWQAGLQTLRVPGRTEVTAADVRKVLARPAPAPLAQLTGDAAPEAWRKLSDDDFLVCYGAWRRAGLRQTAIAARVGVAAPP